MNSKFNVSEILKFVALSIVVGVISYYFAEFSLLVTAIPGHASAFYIPAGLSIAILIVFGVRYLPIILLAKFLLGVSHNSAFYQNIISCMASAVEAYVGYYLYKSFRYLIDEYFEYQSHLAMVLLLGLLAPIFSALIGVTNLFYLGVIPESTYFTHFLTWYSGDLISILIFLPAFLAFGREKHRIFDFFAPLMATGFALLFKFEFIAPYIYVLFLVILVPAIFGSVMGIYYSLIAVACVLNWFLVSHIGPFSFGNLQDNMLSMQFFLLSFAITALSLEGFKKTNLLKSALVPLISFWLLTGMVYYHYHTQKDVANEKIISNLTQDFESSLIEKMSIYENSIKGASGFVAGSQMVSQDEWAQYVTSISVVDHISGVNGVGIVYPELEGSKHPSYIYPEDLNYFTITLCVCTPASVDTLTK